MTDKYKCEENQYEELVRKNEKDLGEGEKGKQEKEQEQEQEQEQGKFDDLEQEQEYNQETEGEQIQDETSYDDVQCVVCQSGEREDQILLCDMCDNAHHMECLVPVLTTVPEGDWFCPACIDKLDRGNMGMGPGKEQNSPHHHVAKRKSTNKIGSHPCIHSCPKCQREFTSALGLNYHLEHNVCLRKKARMLERGSVPRIKRKGTSKEGNTTKGKDSCVASSNSGNPNHRTRPGLKPKTREVFNFSGTTPDSPESTCSEASIDIDDESSDDDVDDFFVRDDDDSVEESRHESNEKEENSAKHDSKRNRRKKKTFSGNRRSVSKLTTSLGKGGSRVYSIPHLYYETKSPWLPNTCQIRNSLTGLEAYTGLQYMTEKVHQSVLRSSSWSSMREWIRRRCPSNFISNPEICFTIKHIDSNGKDNMMIKPMQSESLSSECIDQFINVGGPVVDVTFLPNRGSDRLGVSVVFSLERVGFDDSQAGEKEERKARFDFNQTYEKINSYPNVLQVWNVNVRSSNFLYGVGFEDCGSIIQSVWSPLEPQQLFADSTSRDYMGILAVVSSDGCCRILLMPDRIHTDVRDEPLVDGSILCISKLQIPLCKSASQSDAPLVPIFSATWNPLRPLEIACGLGDGSIALFELNDELSRLMKHSGPENIDRLMRAPVKRFCMISLDQNFSFSYAVTCIQFHRQFEGLLLASGQEGSIRIWGPDDMYRPVYHHKPSLGQICDVGWDPYGHGFFAACSDFNSVLWDPLWGPRQGDAIETTNITVSVHATRDGNVWKVRPIKFEGDTLNVSVSSDGSIRTSTPSRVGLTSPESFMSEIFRIVEVSTGTDHSSDQFGVSISGSEELESPNRNLNICVDCRARTGKDLSCKIDCRTTSAVSLNALDVLEIKGNTAPAQTVVAYGGLIGLVRIHQILS
jgi:hypothetical protein